MPDDTEGLWATQLSDDTARVENVTFLQDGIAQGDVVRFQKNQDGVRWATGRVQASGHCVIRVLPVPSGPLGPSASAVHAAFERFGLGGEVFSAELPLAGVEATVAICPFDETVASATGSALVERPAATCHRPSPGIAEHERRRG